MNGFSIISETTVKEVVRDEAKLVVCENVGGNSAKETLIAPVAYFTIFKLLLESLEQQK